MPHPATEVYIRSYLRRIVSRYPDRDPGLVGPSRIAAAILLRQQTLLNATQDALTGLPWAIFKGAAVSLELYPPGWARRSADADAYIGPHAYMEARTRLSNCGFQQLKADHHAATFEHPTGRLDLHCRLVPDGWPAFPAVDIRMMAGRPLVDERTQTLCLLCHAALTDYPGARPVRALDLALWTSFGPTLDWPCVKDDLGRLGLTQAARRNVGWSQGLLGRALSLPQELQRSRASDTFWNSAPGQWALTRATPLARPLYLASTAQGWRRRAALVQAALKRRHSR